MSYIISKEKNFTIGEISLPSSISISNRLLIIKALSSKDFVINNLSYSDDTKRLSEIIKNNPSIINVEDASTIFRFLACYYANKPGEWVLTGSERLKTRPIGILVNSLKELGVKIEYLEKEGFAPLKIIGKKLEGGTIELFGNISSQFISSLLLIAPCLNKGLTIKFKSKIIAKPHIDMTLSLMKKFGIKSKWESNDLIIEKQNYKTKEYTIEADWISASYWYLAAALSEKSDIKLYGLKVNSIQADSVISSLYDKFGVKTTKITGGVRIRKTKPSINKLNIDLTNNSDLAHTIIVTLSLLDITFTLTGLYAQLLKNSQRFNHFKLELSKLGYNILISDDSISLYKSTEKIKNNQKNINISNIYDHRVVMSLSILALIYNIKVANPNIVNKSYPGYWQDLQKLGYIISEG